MASSSNNFLPTNFNPDIITEFNPALIYAFEPEAELKPSSFYYQLQHSSMQFMDMQNAYQYAQETMLPAIRKKGLHLITLNEFIEFMHQIHSRIASALAKDHGEIAGKFATREMVRCHYGRDFSSMLQSYLDNTKSKNDFFAECDKRGIPRQDILNFLKVTAKFNKKHFISDMAVAVQEHKLSDQELSKINKVFKVVTPVSLMPQKVQTFHAELMKLVKLTQTNNLDSVASLAFFVFNGLVQIHPYFNGNGRLATLMMNVILRYLGQPSILLRYPKERFDPNSSYAIAIREIDAHPELLKRHIAERIKAPLFEDAILKRAVASQVCLALVAAQLQIKFPQAKVDKLVDVNFNKHRKNPLGTVQMLTEMPEASTRNFSMEEMEKLCLVFAADSTRKDLEAILKPSSAVTHEGKEEKLQTVSNKMPVKNMTIDDHDLLLKKMEDALSAENMTSNLRSIFKPFFTALNNKEYSKALRIACNAKGHEAEALALIKVLYSFKDKLNINKDEKPASSHLSAVDYARQNSNYRILLFLEYSNQEKAINHIQARFRGNQVRLRFFKQVKLHDQVISELQNKIATANDNRDFKTVGVLGKTAEYEQSIYNAETRIIARWKK